MNPPRIAQRLVQRYGALTAVVKVAHRHARWADRLDHAGNTADIFHAATRVTLWRTVASVLARLHQPPDPDECACRDEVGPCGPCTEGATDGHADEPYSDAAARIAPNPANTKLHKP